MASRYLPFPLPEGLRQQINLVSAAAQDRYVSKRLPECDIFVGHEAAGLLSGQAAKRRGIRYVCDHGCTHPEWREDILNAEYERAGIRRTSLPPFTIKREKEQYELADRIVVPSNFAKRSFVEKGIPERKMSVVPYGVNLSMFNPVGRPSEDRFDVLFVGGLSVRKGAFDLFRAFDQLAVAGKHLTIVGTISEEVRANFSAELSRDHVSVLGARPQAELRDIMSRSHVLVLPSLEEGLALVQAEAMACGCPIIATSHTGSEDLFTDGVEGYIIPIRSPDAITEKLTLLASDRDRRDTLSKAAIAKVRSIGGWANYGDAMKAVYSSII
ncbi:glycosyltransferase family 4 protein [Caulobacter segnis]